MHGTSKFVHNGDTSKNGYNFSFDLKFCGFGIQVLCTVTKVLLSLERLFRVFWLQYIVDSFSFLVLKRQ